MKYIVLSVNRNVDYMYYVPLTMWSWRRIGYEPLCIYVGQQDEISEMVFASTNKVIIFNSIEGIRDATIAQVSRLYVAALPSLKPDDYLLLGDSDMIALGDHWNPDLRKITIYNHDLTGYTEYPMCYAGMPVSLWRHVFNLNSCDWNALINRDLKDYANAKSQDFYQWWGCDQQILTQRIKQHGTGNIDFINRGQYANGYAKGRVDRGSWSLQHDQFIDCHMHRDLFKAFYPDPNPQHVVKWQQHMDMLNKVWPGEDFTWFVNYSKEYAKLAYGK